MSSMKEEIEIRLKELQEMTTAKYARSEFKEDAKRKLEELVRFYEVMYGYL